MDDLIIRAARFAKQAHLGQHRKYTGRPYIEHPSRVAGRVLLLDDATGDEIAAAWLHDVVEDCAVTPDTLLAHGFSSITVELVLELTNPSTQHQALRRFERREMDRIHLRSISHAAKRIKLIDRADNLRDSVAADPEFKSLYVAESILLANCLLSVDDELLDELFDAIDLLGFPRNHTHPLACS